MQYEHRNTAAVLLQGPGSCIARTYVIVREKKTDQTKSTNKEIYHPNRRVRHLRLPKQAHSVPRLYKVVYNRSDSRMHSGGGRIYDAPAHLLYTTAESPVGLTFVGLETVDTNIPAHQGKETER